MGVSSKLPRALQQGYGSYIQLTVYFMFRIGLSGGTV
jgi:hypothetical protein